MSARLHPHLTAPLGSSELDSTLAATLEQRRTLPLMPSYSEPAAAPINASQLVEVLPTALARALRSLARTHALDLPSTLQLAFAVFLARYTGQSTIHVSVAPGRPALDSAAGDAQVFDLNVVASSSFAQLIEHHRSQFASFTVPPTQAGSALLRAAVRLIYCYTSSERAHPISQQRRYHDGQIELSITDPAQDGPLNWHFYLGARAAGSLGQLSSHFLTLLAGIVADPAQPISRLPLLTPAERWQLLVEWNSTDTPYPDTQCIHTLFEAQVAATPEATALLFGAERITYRTLNRRANRVARRLRALGVGPDVLVGLCTDRSPDQIASLLGILKAGGAYVPLDPVYPPERLALMLADTQAPVLLTQRHLLERLPAHTGHVLTIEELGAAGEDDDINPAYASAPDQLAYVIYTSGSTGVPKGVLIEHGGLVSHTYTMISSHALDQHDRVLQFSALGFDASAATLFPALLAGAALVLPEVAPSELLGDQLTQLCEQQQVSVIQLPASVWHRWVDDLMLRGTPLRLSLKALLVGGESPSPDKLRDWMQIIGRPMTFLNAYGPTEATITATLFAMHCDEAGAATLSSIPIGCPLANKQIYLLDEHMQIVPIGAPGELYIGGVGLARGYLNRPELTAERFVEWASTPGAPPIRLYRSGDLARYWPDGQIEFLGRVDQQVKLRGFRIELGEIEATLRQHPLVRDVVVLAREDTPGLPQLVAYVVPSELDPAPAALQLHAELRGFLRTKLPDYMVPAAYVPLAAMPLNSNGKLDRRALPAPSLDQGDTPGIAVPRNPEEALLAEIWASVLGRTHISIHDDFFALGGHSLLAARAMALLTIAIGRSIPLRVMYEAPTVAAFAPAISRSTNRPAPAQPLDLAADVALDPSIRPAAYQPQPTPARAIFLTGATGFVGTFLLGQLLEQTQATIYCLVRAATAGEGAQRLQQALLDAQLWQPAWRRRIVPVLGDLRQPLLGLGTAAFANLAATIEVIYHAGAEVHYISPYSALRAANVQGSIEVLRLACQIHPKPIHYLSTLAVAVLSEQDVQAQAGDATSSANPQGYALSKWVAEGIMQLARQRGLPIAIYRPGRIGCHSRSGVANPNDFFIRMLAACLEIGQAPDAALVENLMPVDFVTQAIVYLSQQPQLANETFQMLNPRSTPWHEVVAAAQAFGLPIQSTPYQDWYRALTAHALSAGSHSLLGLLSLLPQDNSETSWLADWPKQTFDLSQMTAGLAGSGIACPVIDRQIFDRLFTMGIQRRLLPAPTLAHADGLRAA